jgi:putative tricarboxylic transport membrane protein
MKNPSDVLGSLFLFLVGVGAIIGAVRLHVGSPTEPQPGFFPFLAGISLIVLSSIIVFQGWLGHGRKKVAFGEVRRPALLLAVLIVLVAVLDRLGYVIGTFIASGLILRILDVKSWRVLIITSLGLSVGTYILFDRLLGIDLPVGMLARFGL